MTRRRWLVPLLALSVGSGCATVVRGTRQTVHFESVPAGAELHHKATRESWITPVDVALRRDSRHELVVSKEGYLPQEIYIRSEVPFLWWFIDAFTLGISTALDAIFGGLYDLKPDRVTVVLDPAPTQPRN